MNPQLPIYGFCQHLNLSKYTSLMLPYASLFTFNLFGNSEATEFHRFIKTKCPENRIGKKNHGCLYTCSGVAGVF